MLNFGLIGLGQYGGRQVDAFMHLGVHYQGFAINTAINDLAGLEHIPERSRFNLKGYTSGAGRTPQIAYAAMQENARELYPLVREVSDDTDFTFLVAGLGGGTGTGVLSWLLDEFDMFFGYAESRVGLIITLPRDSDGAVEKANAVGILGQISAKIEAKKLGAVLLLDNDRFYTQFAKDRRGGDWRDLSNLELAKTFNEINLLTGISGSSNFDPTDFMSLLQTSGFLVLGKASLKEISPASVSATVKNSIERGWFASGYKYDEAKSYSICFSLDPYGERIRQADYEISIGEALTDLFPHVYNKFTGYYAGEENRVFILAAGLGVPDRALILNDQLQDLSIANTRPFSHNESLSNILGINPLSRHQGLKTQVSTNPYGPSAEGKTRAAKEFNNPFLNNK